MLTWWLATHRLTDLQLTGLLACNSKCDRLIISWLAMWYTRKLQLLDSRLTVHWLATSNSLVCNLVILITLLCGFCSAELFFVVFMLQIFLFLLLFTVKQLTLNDINLEQIFQEFNADQKTRTLTTFVGKSFGAAQTRKTEIML